MFPFSLLLFFSCVGCFQERSLLFQAVRWLLTEVASLLAERGL